MYPRMILIILAHLICAGAWGGELEPKFSSIKQNILEPHCAECHGPGGSQSAIDIFSYKYLRDPDAPLVIPGNLKDSDLYTEVSTYDMPPRTPAIA